MKMTIRKDNSFNRHYRDEHCQIHKLKFFRFPEEVFKHSPQKIRNAATPMYFKVSGVASIFCPITLRRNETRKKSVAFVLRRSWRRICNAPTLEWHGVWGNVAAWRQFFGVSREDNCDVFEKSFFRNHQHRRRVFFGVLFGR